jgi:hypothetical protein
MHTQKHGQFALASFRQATKAWRPRIAHRKTSQRSLRASQTSPPRIAPLQRRPPTRSVVAFAFGLVWFEDLHVLHFQTNAPPLASQS